jgi:uncharacterized protein (TIGR00369 family)
VQEWLEGSPFDQSLGVELVEMSDTSVRLFLPFRDVNANPGGALHGGCAASLGLIGGQVLARRALGDAAETFVTASCHVRYLAAAIGKDVFATAELARRGRELCFIETRVDTVEGKSVARVSSVVFGRSGAPPPGLARANDGGGGSEPGPMGSGVEALPFIRARQLRVEHMQEGRSRLVMPLGSANADQTGDFHEGAVLALLDTTGAMAAWAITGPGPFKASTAAIEGHILGTLSVQELVACGRVVQRDRSIFWSEVEVSDREGFLHARGTVLYRIVTGET